MAWWAALVSAVLLALINVTTWAVNQHSAFWERFLPHRKAPLVVVGSGTSPDPLTYWALELIDLRGTTTSHFVPRWVVLAIYIVGCLYWIGFFPYADSAHVLHPNLLLFYTNWTFMLFFVVQFVGAVLTCSDRRTYPKDSRGSFRVDFLNMRRLRIFHTIAFQVAAPCSLFLSLFYWGVIYRGETDPVIPASLFVHGLNNLFFLAAVFLTRAPFVSTHYFALLLYTTTYATMMWIVGGVTGFWPYSTLTFEPMSIAYYVALPLLVAMMFFAYLLLAKLREHIARRVGREDDRSLGDAASPLLI